MVITKLLKLSDTEFFEKKASLLGSVEEILQVFKDRGAECGHFDLPPGESFNPGAPEKAFDLFVKSS